jgi:hypothetical protein
MDTIKTRTTDFFLFYYHVMTFFYVVVVVVGFLNRRIITIIWFDLIEVFV